MGRRSPPSAPLTDAQQAFAARHDGLALKAAGLFLSRNRAARSCEDDIIAEARYKLALLATKYQEDRGRPSTFIVFSIKRHLWRWWYVECRDRDHYRPWGTDPATDCAVDNPDERTPLPEARLEQAEARLVLNRALDSMPELYRLVMKLRYFHDLSQPEIGRLLGITKAGIQQNEAKALHWLKKWFVHYEVVDPV